MNPVSRIGPYEDIDLDTGLPKRLAFGEGDDNSDLSWSIVQGMPHADDAWATLMHMECVHVQRDLTEAFQLRNLVLTVGDRRPFVDASHPLCLSSVCPGLENLVLKRMGDAAVDLDGLTMLRNVVLHGMSVRPLIRQPCTFRQLHALDVYLPAEFQRRADSRVTTRDIVDLIRACPVLTIIRFAANVEPHPNAAHEAEFYGVRSTCLRELHVVGAPDCLDPPELDVGWLARLMRACPNLTPSRMLVDGLSWGTAPDLEAFAVQWPRLLQRARRVRPLCTLQGEELVSSLRASVAHYSGQLDLFLAATDEPIDAARWMQLFANAHRLYLRIATRSMDAVSKAIAKCLVTMRSARLIRLGGATGTAVTPACLELVAKGVVAHLPVQRGDGGGVAWRSAVLMSGPSAAVAANMVTHAAWLNAFQAVVRFEGPKWRMETQSGTVRFSGGGDDAEVGSRVLAEAPVELWWPARKRYYVAYRKAIKNRLSPRFALPADAIGDAAGPSELGWGIGVVDDVESQESWERIIAVPS